MAKTPQDTIDQDFSQYYLPEPDPNSSTVPIVPSADGAVLSSGNFSSPNFVSGVTGWRLDSQGNFEGVSGTFSGTVNVSSLNIPNTTTANSFHTDSSGNSWWGANVASGYSNANAYILATGAAVFKNVQIGGTVIQYVITNSGIFSYGDGSDGTATCDGSTAVAGMTLAGSTYTMTRDVYFSSLTINSGIILKPSGYRPFISNTLTNNGTIQGDGVAAGDGTTNGNGGTGGTQGSALADGYLKGSVSGSQGGHGAAPAFGNGSAGGSGSNTTNSIGTSGIGGPAGGQSSDNNLLAGGSSTGGTATVSNVKLIANWHLATLLDIGSTGTTIKFDNSAGSGAGGGGGGSVNGGGSAGGGGGGSGSSGRILAIYAKSIAISATGSITSNGGNGGNGGNGILGGVGKDGGGGSGGSGGNGGVIILVYNSLSNSGSITASAGTKGTKGLKSGGTAQDGSDGTNGSAGTIYQFQLSL